MRSGAGLASLLLLCSCTSGLFSGSNFEPDATRPVVRIETRGGVEYGAATSEGVLFLGRTATTGPCRVHYFLGRTPVVEDGTIVPFGGVYYRADVDLKQQRAELLTKDPDPSLPLVALLHRELDVARVPVRLARGGGLDGDIVEWPGTTLPVGTGIFTPAENQEDGWRLVGLVSGEATLEQGASTRKLIVFAGVDRLREAMATPVPWPEPMTVKHRMDDISLTKRRAEIR